MIREGLSFGHRVRRRHTNRSTTNWLRCRAVGGPLAQSDWGIWMTSANEILSVCVCVFQSWQFPCCPSLHPKLDYDGIDFVARPPGHAGGLELQRGWWHVSGDNSGWEREQRGEVNSEREGWLPVTMLDLCWKESAEASREPQIISPALRVTPTLTQT